MMLDFEDVGFIKISTLEEERGSLRSCRRSRR